MSNSRRNPLNVKNNLKNPWKGSDATDSRSHAVFKDEADGWRAAWKTLAAKYAAGKRTLRSIISSWAPKSDTIGSIPGNMANNPDEYAETIAHWCGINPDQDLDLFKADGKPGDIELLLMIGQSMERYENGTALNTQSLGKSIEGLGRYICDFCK